MTVARLRREMENDELMRWSVYFGRRNQEQELVEKAAQQRQGR